MLYIYICISKISLTVKQVIKELRTQMLEQVPQLGMGAAELLLWILRNFELSMLIAN